MVPGIRRLAFRGLCPRVARGLKKRIDVHALGTLVHGLLRAQSTPYLELPVPDPAIKGNAGEPHWSWRWQSRGLGTRCASVTSTRLPSCPDTDLLRSTRGGNGEVAVVSNYLALRAKNTGHCVQVPWPGCLQG